MRVDNRNRTKGFPFVTFHRGWKFLVVFHGEPCHLTPKRSLATHLKMFPVSCLELLRRRFVVQEVTVIMNFYQIGDDRTRPSIVSLIPLLR